MNRREISSSHLSSPLFFYISRHRSAADLDFEVFRFVEYGKNRIKTFAVSPDVYVQLMLQWTYFK